MCMAYYMVHLYIFYMPTYLCVWQYISYFLCLCMAEYMVLPNNICQHKCMAKYIGILYIIQKSTYVCMCMSKYTILPNIICMSTCYCVWQFIWHFWLSPLIIIIFDLFGWFNPHHTKPQMPFNAHTYDAISLQHSKAIRCVWRTFDQLGLCYVAIYIPLHYEAVVRSVSP